MQPGARERVSETPACLGRRFSWAEGASQKPLNGLRTRGSQGPDDSQGHAVHMEHERGAFKVIRRIWPDAVKKWQKIRGFHDGGTPRRPRSAKNVLPEI